MKNYYAVFILLFSSCGTTIRFIGNAHTPTKTVDVYVEKSAIQKPYTVIGKGYVEQPVGIANPEKIQQKAILKAKEKGADGIFISDYALATSEPGTTTVSLSDSTHTQISNQVATRYNAEPMFVVYFIKYSGRK